MSYPVYEEMHDSGVEWLGNVPSHWHIQRLKTSVVSIKNGIWGNEPAGDDNDIICLRVADFNRQQCTISPDNLTTRNVAPSDRYKRLVSRGDLLLEKSGGGDLQPVGFVVHFDYDFPSVCSNFIARMELVKTVNSQFLKYVYSAAYAVRLNTRSIKQTTGIQNLDAEEYLNELGPFPPFTEQQRIAAFLDAKTAEIDELIALKERQVALLQQKRMALISRAVTKGLDPHAPMRDSGVAWLGEVPAEWKIKRLKFVAVIQSGLTLGRDYRGQQTVIRPYLRVANVQDGFLDLENITQIALPPLEAGRYELRVGDVLMTEGGDFDKLGRGYVWEGQIQDCLHQNHIFAVRPNQREVLPRFLSYLMTSLHGKNYFTSTAQQTTNLATTNSTKLGDFPLILPPLNVQQEIIGYLERETDHTDSLVETIQEQIGKLNIYRQALITAAVTGKIDVRGTDIQTDVEG